MRNTLKISERPIGMRIIPSIKFEVDVDKAEIDPPHFFENPLPPVIETLAH
jgi:hypothetical protein